MKLTSAAPLPSTATSGSVARPVSAFVTDDQPPDSAIHHRLHGDSELAGAGCHQVDRRAPCAGGRVIPRGAKADARLAGTRDVHDDDDVPGRVRRSRHYRSYAGRRDVLDRECLRQRRTGRQRPDQREY
jgi:hypothetical protein